MARDFNGTTDRIDWAAVSNLTTHALTISAWIYSDGQAGNSDYILEIHASGDAATGLSFYLSGTATAALSRRGTSATLFKGAYAAASLAGAWHHVLVTHTGNFADYSTIHVYFDGVEGTADASPTNGSGEVAQTGSWSIGGRIYDDNRNFDGKIAFMGVWDAVVDAATIAGLAAGKTPDTYPTNLLFYAIRGDDYKNIVTSAAGTLDGTSTYLDPPIIQPAIDTGHGTDEITVTKASAGTSISVTDTASTSDASPVYKPSVAYRSSDNDGINEGFSDTVLGAIKPVGLCVNDVLLVFVCYKSNSNINITFDTGDWKEINDAHVINTTPTEDLHGRVFWKRAVDTDILDSFFNWVVTFSSLVKNPNLIITAYSGAVTNSIPYTVVSTTYGNGNCNLPSITTSKNNDLIVGFVGNSVYSSWSSSSLTERQDIRCVASYDGLQPIAGASGTKLISSSITDEYIGIILNLSTESIIKSANEVGTGADSKPSISASLSLLESGIGVDRISNISALLSIIDSSLGTDIISILIPLLKLITDVGSGSDQVLNILASLSVSELSTVLEAVTQLVSLTLTENGRGVDSSALAASLGLSDTGTVIDYLGLSALLSLIDAGVSSDAIANIIASLSVTDTSSASDIESILKAILILITDTGLGDWGTGVELILDIADSITGIDTISTLASLLVSDSGTTTELINVLTAVIVAIQEYGSGSDQVANLLASLSVNEISTITEILLQLISLSVSDAGSGSDIVNVITATLKAVTDAASGLDGVSISASMSLVDNGSGVDNLSLTVSLTIRDTGLGTDAISVLVTALKQILDTASGTDRLTISASLNIPETMYGIDAPTIAASLIGYDIGISSDSPQIQASLTLTDTSSASDILTVLQTALKIVQDLASGSDFVGSISASIPVSDNVFGADQIAQLLASLMVTDFGTGVDIVVSYDITTQIIKISFIIKKSAITFAFAYPRIEFSFLDGG